MTENLLQITNEIHAYSALLLKAFTQSTEERLQSYGVTISSLQLVVLRMLENGTLTSSELSRRLALDPASMVRIVDTLERNGLAARGIDPKDRRRNPLEITEAGRTLVMAIPNISEGDVPYQALKSLGTVQLCQLRDLLRQVIQQFPEGRLVSNLLAGQPDPNGPNSDQNAD